MRYVEKEFKRSAWKYGRVTFIFSAIILGGLFVVKDTKVGAQTGQQVRRELPWAGVTRTYLEYIPATYDPKQPHPLVLALHGGGGNANRFSEQTMFAQKAEAEGFIVVHPNGTPFQLPGTPLQDGNHRWNAYEPAGADDVGFLSALIDRLEAEYNIDPNRIYLTGFSNGAMMTYRMACDFATRFAAVAPVSGSWKYGPDGVSGTANVDCVPERTIPFMYYRGTLEESIPTRDTEDAECEAFWSARNGCDATPMVDTLTVNGETIERERYVNCADGAEVSVMNVVDAGHNWHASATDQIWEFLKRHTKSPVTPTATPTVTPTPTPTPSCIYDFGPVTDFIQRNVEGIPLQGASLLIIKDGRVIYEQAFGSYTLDTRIPIASASKWPSASVIMSLVDEGILSLDDRVSTYIPSFTGEKADITVRQLFSHTSGLPGDDVGCLSNQSIRLAECVEQIARVPLIAAPGTAFAYGGNSMQVGGRVAEIVSGKLWDDLFQERIAHPLGLQSSDYALQSTAPGYVRVTNPRIAGGMRSTLGDYGRFVLMHVNNGTIDSNQILSSAIIAEGQRDQTFGAPIINSPHPTAVGYGLGQWRDVVDAEGTAAQLSSQGAFGFSPWIDKQRNLAAVFLVRNQLRNVYGMVSQMQGMIRHTVDSAPCHSNAPPTVTITAPADGTTVTAPAAITISADANDSDGAVEQVEFYSGETLLHTATSSPYRFAWSDLAAGTYTLTAVATDNLGAATTSAAVMVTVESAPTGGTLSDHTIAYDDITRDYKKYVPAGLPNKGVPLVFVLHGGGGLGAASRIAPGQPFYRWRELADRDKFIIIYPEGIDGNWNDCRSDAPRRTCPCRRAA